MTATLDATSAEATVSLKRSTTGGPGATSSTESASGERAKGLMESVNEGVEQLGQRPKNE